MASTTRSLLLVLFLTYLYADTVVAQVAVAVSGEYIFGPDVSEAEACRRAEDRAKEAAVRKANGESFFSESMIDCHESDGNDCRYSRTTISHLNGFLLALEETRTQVWDKPPMRVCRVTGVANVDKKSVSGKLYFRASLNRSVFQTGDEVRFTLEIPVTSFLAIFSQTGPTTEKFIRIYPNRHEQGNPVVGKFILPTPGSGYRLVASTNRLTTRIEKRQSDNQPLITRSTLVDSVVWQTEYLYLIATEERVHWLEQYSAVELQAHLSVISPESRFIKVLAYRILQ
jgi:hypothetical protein